MRRPFDSSPWADWPWRKAWCRFPRPAQSGVPRETPPPSVVSNILRMSDRAGRPAVLLGLLVLVLGIVSGLALGHWRYSPGPFLRPMKMAGRWLRAPGEPCYSGVFRRRVAISGPVKHGWVAIAARDGFEVCVNGNPVGRLLAWRPTRPFQLGLSEAGQSFNPPQPAMALNFPREYQWTAHRNDWLPTYLDITPHLRPGRNVITVDIESRVAPAMFRLDGEILLWSGERIRLDSDTAWRGEPVPPFDVRHDWTEPACPDLVWRAAIDCATDGLSLPDRHYHAFDERVLTTPFTGSWIRSDVAGADDAVWFESEWELPGQPDDAWLRLAVNRHCDLFVNEFRVVAPTLGNPDLDSGDWLLGTPRGADMPAVPELLDPDEVGSLFVGDRFESPRHGDPSTLVFKTLDRSDELLTVSVTHDKARATTRSDMPGTYDPIKDPSEGVMPHDPLPAQPEARDVKALGRNRSVGGLLAYDVRSLVRPGVNRIRVRLVPPPSSDSLQWAPQFAIDGEARFRNDLRRGFASGPTSHWSVRTQDLAGALGPFRQALVAGPAKVLGKAWPGTLYRGIAHDTTRVLHAKLWCLAAGIGIAAGATLLVLGALAAGVRVPELAGRLKSRAAPLVAARLLLPAIAVFLVALCVKSTWSERHEGILFRLPRVWPAVAILAALAMPSLSILSLRRLAGRLRDLPRTPAWPVLVACLLVGSAILRIHKLDFQPLDDDEYASCQAILAIAETGAPGFAADGVYYTRSPAYHYLVGGLVRLFGPTLWAMRLPSAAFGVATTLLIVQFGQRLLGRPWVGLAAAVLYALHPFAIFSAHLVRFYQQQQFFTLLCLWYFCKGFVGRPSQSCRALTVLAFLAAVLSQEITIVLGPQLALGVLFFARGGEKGYFRLALLSAVAIGFIFLDLVVFQVVCLTRTEGVSPSVEATISPHFWDAYNNVAMLVGYSRLHLAPSLLLVAMLPVMLRRGSRVEWALLYFLASGAVLTNLLVTNVSLRYQYWLTPLWLLLVVDALRLLVDRIAVATRPPGEPIAETRGVAPLIAIPLIAGLLLVWSPWRVLGSYDCKLLGDSTGAFRFVGANRRPGDVVVATEPHPHTAILEAGRVDYDLTVPMLYDFLVLQNGRLVDRNGGAEAIGSLDELMAACRRHERMWIVVNREKLRSRSKNLRWEYPAARVELFLRKNCQIAHRSYLWTVFLWDHSRGTYTPFRGM